MTTPFWRKSGHAVLAGLLMAGLRAAQVRTAFDPATGLALPSVPGTVLLACMAFLLIAEPLLQRRASRAHVRLAAALAPVGRGALTALVCGAMVLIAAGGFWAASGLLQGGRSAIVQALAGALGAASGCGLLLMIRALRQGDGQPVNVAPLLPFLFFTVFLVLAVYLPSAVDPVLERYWLQVLAAALAAFGFSRLTGLVQGEATPRGLLTVGNWAVAVCLAMLGDGAPLALRGLYLACALILAAFTALLRDDLPEKDPEGEVKKGKKQ